MNFNSIDNLKVFNTVKKEKQHNVNDFNFSKLLNNEYNIYEIRNGSEQEKEFIIFDINEKMLIYNEKTYGEINEEKSPLLILPAKKKRYILKCSYGTLYIIVYKKDGNFFVKYKNINNKKFNKKINEKQIIKDDFFDKIENIKNHFYLNKYLLEFSEDMSLDKYKKIFVEGEHGSGKTTIIDRYNFNRKVFISVEGENLYATPIHIIYDKVKQNLGLFRWFIIKLGCSFRLNIIPLVGAIGILILFKRMIVPYFSFENLIFFGISYLVISFFYYDIIIHIKQTTAINRNEFFRFINLSSKIYNIAIIIEDLDRINDYKDWKSEIIYLCNNLKYGKLIVSYTNKLNCNQVFDKDEIKKHFDVDFKYYNQIYLYCNILYGKYKDINLLKINSFRELKKKLISSYNDNSKKEDLSKNPNYVLYKFITTKDEESLFETMGYFKECIQKLFSRQEILDSEYIIFLSIIFLDDYNKNFRWLNEFEFNEKIKKIKKLCQKYYEVHLKNQENIIDVKEERFECIFDNLLDQYARIYQ